MCHVLHRLVLSYFIGRDLDLLTDLKFQFTINQGHAIAKLPAEK